ncbi:hypothetical protein CAI21_15215 [Alkalilimnicola ehrlichii]|uniref:HmuY protein n=2 Tax=Alkalilimnicola ehrlichii TaxID=351052 RepID=A0A3E0WR53_9GAMM|nr:hypothetical protein CAI21_15215 [Alkalilimnicola ehrlichii]RFA35444.1 hypothetical protein CAL65_12870 [Alkalilimnicola ehrlichii]
MAAVLLAGCGGSSSSETDPPIELPETVTSTRVDASSYGQWVYFNLDEAKPVALSEAEAAASTDWHIAFRRFDIKLNGGTSGPGQVAGAVVKPQNHFYHDNGEPNVSVFTNVDLNAQAQLLLEDFPEPARNAWQFDRLTSALRGSSATDGGWYRYDSDTFDMVANPDNGWLIRSGEGDSYARLRMTELTFATRSGRGIEHFRFELDVQPAGADQLYSSAVFEGELPLGGDPICFDFDSNLHTSCTGSEWDLQFGVEGHALYLLTNSGDSGPGEGGAFGPFEWQELSAFVSALYTPSGDSIAERYTADASSGLFVDMPWQEYDLLGGHRLWPNYRVYLIDTNRLTAEAPQYALQVTNYYDEADTSGHVSFRYRLVNE